MGGPQNRPECWEEERNPYLYRVSNHDSSVTEPVGKTGPPSPYIRTIFLYLEDEGSNDPLDYTV